MPATPPTMKEAFNAMSGGVYGTSVLYVTNGAAYTYYDFAQRVVMTNVQGGYNMTPFSQMDREVLVEAREKLISLGGNPPELPPEAVTGPALQKRSAFNP